MLRRCALFGLLAGGVVACASREPIEVAAFEARAPNACAPARDSHFEDGGAAALQRYVQQLALTQRGAGVPSPRDVTLTVVDSEPKPGLAGVTAGEVTCADGTHRGPYRIALYRKALVGRPVAAAYHTAAHEFRHVVQIRRDRLPCGPSEETREDYEREAAAFADALVPACR